MNEVDAQKGNKPNGSIGKLLDGKYLLIVFGMALLWWLSGYFVTKDTFSRHELTQEAAFERLEKSLDEMRTDIKVLLRESRK